MPAPIKPIPVKRVFEARGQSDVTPKVYYIEHVRTIARKKTLCGLRHNESFESTYWLRPEHYKATTCSECRYIVSSAKYDAYDFIRD